MGKIVRTWVSLDKFYHFHQQRYSLSERTFQFTCAADP